MAHGLNSVLRRGVAGVNCRNEGGGKGVGSRRIFAPHFKLQVLDSYRSDIDCKGNQRATARKYGIHRRQIQKWLQVETTLRNSVSNVSEKVIVADKNLTCDNRKSCNNDFEMALNGNRQRDDESASTASGIEARVPALTQSPSAASYTSPPLPLDYTIHGRVYTASPIVARVDSPLASPYSAAPIDLSFKRHNSMTVFSAPECCLPLSPQKPLPLSSPEPHPDVWDLSTKSKCRSPSPVQTPSLMSAAENISKPVKLFKPYLDDLHEPEDTVMTKLEPCYPIAMIPSNESYNYNNNICDVKFEYTNTYTLHELQPKSMNYYSPYSEYEVGVYCYEDIGYGQNLTPIKHRQSYSLDFKLSAIDCYYQDSVCKGNQRAVATKYNIHRRQVQKWLKQAEELKLRNESIKQLHVVR